MFLKLQHSFHFCMLFCSIKEISTNIYCMNKFYICLWDLIGWDGECGGRCRVWRERGGDRWSRAYVLRNGDGRLLKWVEIHAWGERYVESMVGVETWVWATYTHSSHSASDPASRGKHILLSTAHQDLMPAPCFQTSKFQMATAV